MPITTTDGVTSYSALLVGGLIAFSLTGTVSVQCMVYFRLFPRESSLFKGLVAGIWLLDLIHSAFIGASLYLYFINWFGEESQINVIPWSVAFTVVITAVQTFIAHCFFANKIYRSSKKNWYFTGPVVFLAFLRLIAAGTSTGEMIAVGHYSSFNRAYPGWIFTLGLSLSSAVDVLIAGCLIYLLRKLKLQMGSTSKMSVFSHLSMSFTNNRTSRIKVVDTLTLYTLENGFLTGVATTASLICWLSMPHNLSFLGLHFVIEKLYANSILASLNTRKELRDMRPRISPWADRSLPVLTADDFGSNPPRDPLNMLNPLDRYNSRPSTPIKQSRMPLEVTVERVIEQESESLRALAVMSRSNSDSSNKPNSNSHTRVDSAGSTYKYDHPKRVSRTPTIMSWKQHTHAEYPDFDLPDMPRYP
ncbi:hypothetical protein GYMLUDRAFT_260402 [Collybiopsis luxurians FD-317 M1]|uniref:DUF6534 domain-containing protein n=1 Tax=Collybiopsis luxurians FD-317 M1 TaxID=944289 RepID=A0A0D0CSG8_9AGAR|nr:hypothetical protein GYMLUDRAFT_260402 [Collybiopsis luxurians FD-317 M1]